MTVQIDLAGKVAFVTGAAGGIGSATTRRLLEAGCTVVANVHSLSDRACEVVADFEAIRPGAVTIIEGSIAEPAVVEQSAKLIFQKFKRLDVVVNNAAVMSQAYLGMISDEMIESVLSTNLGSVIRVTQTMSRLMRRNKSGSIINISSIIGLRGNPAQLVYGASKAGVIGLTLTASKELAPHGVRVNAVAPGVVDTSMIANLETENREKIISQIAMGRIGTPEDIADVILFLASDLSRYVTGQVVGVDGGWAL
jgi:3-oxoacyl-[acyl-carrier protein] reductase